MDKYKTVSEVCRLTGLTRKHLYYFHHEKVVQAAAYANYSVHGYDGYKLYDDAAVEKLQQIALYYQLGLKRDEIRRIMLAPDYDSDLALDKLQKREQAKKETIERHIAALEYLKQVGAKNRRLSPLRTVSLETLGETVLDMQAYASGEALFKSIQQEEFMAELQNLTGQLDADKAEDLKGLTALAEKYLGENGRAFLTGLFTVALGGGAEIAPLVENITPEMCLKVLRYLLIDKRQEG